MPDEIKTETVEEKVIGSTTETVEAKVTESAEELARRLQNKTEEAARLHKRIEKFEQEEADRKKAALTETERLQQDRDQALAKAKQLETKQAQRDVAEKVGLPSVFADRIKGATPEEMEADAKLLLENMPKAPKKPGPGPSMTPESATPSQTTDADRKKFLFG